MPLYLGFDCSTQSLTAIVIDIRGGDRRIVFERSIDFDRAFPGYGTTNGVRRDPDDPAIVVSSPLMWAEALERMMAIVARESGLDLSDIRALSGSGQQHGSVYLDEGASRVLATLDPRRALVDQLRGCFSRADAPVWMDRSTSAECASIERALGGASALAHLTGSRAFERFTGPQIRKFSVRDPDGYARTDRVHLVSSYLASLLAGGHAPVEPGDAAGMNLMDIVGRDWAPAALDATAPDLARRLPAVRESWTVVSPLAPYWTERHGFPAAKVVAWTGDNPSSLIGTGLVREGRVAISLGTSDTLFGLMREPRIDPSGAAHVFGSPTGAYMSLVCFMNGSLARERIRQAFGMTWEEFSRALRATAPGNRGAVMLPWFEPEITPPVPDPGVRRYGLDATDGPSNVRAVVEAQLLAMRRHSRWMGVRIDTIHATGGAAVNRDILQVLADVFDADVYQLPAGNSACLGAALRAYHADAVSDGNRTSWDEVVTGFAEPVADSRVRPIREHAAIYADVEPLHAACEAHARHAGADPMPLLQVYRAGKQDDA
jgi:xylulokinase